MSTPNSAIIWQGPSPKNGAYVVVIISGMSGKSDNDKTGAMAQVDILVADTHPVEARKRGEDVAICGECPLRSTVCYVNVGFAPASKFRAYQRGSYPVLTPNEANAILRKNGVDARAGSYGDPGIVPVWVWRDLFAGIGHTAYTHQWREPWFDAGHFEYAMASIDHINTRDLLKSTFPGARTYRIADDYNDIGQDEIKCPSKNANGDRVVQCVDCGLCAGMARQAKDIVIVEND